MPKGGTKTRKQQYVPRRVKSAEERNAGRGQFVTLKNTGDQFVGYALFKPDPELDKNPGYYEYFEHYTPATGYMPCAGDNCPLCAEGDNPSTRAKMVFLMSPDNKDTDPDNMVIKIWTANWSVIQEFADYYADDEPVIGQLFRVKRLEGNGKYAVRIKDKKIKVGEVNKLLKADEMPDLEALATKQLNRVMQELDVEEAMNDDDDDDDNEEDGASKSKSRKGTPAKGKKEEKSDDGDDDAFDPEKSDEFAGNVEIVKVLKSKNILTVQDENETEFDVYGTEDIDVADHKKGDELSIAASKDEDGDFVLDAEPGESEAEAESGDGVSDTFEGVVSIKSINTDEETLTVETEDGDEFDLFFLNSGEDDNGRDWSELDFDDYEEGQQVTIVAAKDDEGDMLASAFPEAEKKAKSSKGGKKGGKSKKK